MLVRELETPWEELEPLVREMHQRKLLLPLSDRWLAVAVEGETPSMPTAHVFPGGYLAAQPRPHHPQDAPWSIRGCTKEGSISMQPPGNSRLRGMAGNSPRTASDR